jgi:hypothetical protein
VLETLLKDPEEFGIRVTVIWIPMLPGDSEAEARKAAADIYSNAEASHFYDGERLVGRTFARVIGAEEGNVAWDFYMFFRKGQAWEDEPPTPEDWVHQLGDAKWADPRRYRTGVALLAELQQAARRIG